MNAIKSFFSWIADLFISLFGKKRNNGAEKPTLCGWSSNVEREK